MSRFGPMRRSLTVLVLTVGCSDPSPATTTVELATTTTAAATITTVEQLVVDVRPFEVMDCGALGGVVEISPTIGGWGGREINYTISLYEDGKLISTDEYMYRPGDYHRIRVGSCDYELIGEVVSVAPAAP